MFLSRARRRIRRITLLPLLLWMALAGAALAAERPLILLTNDDGAGAPGLEALYRSVKDLGEVVVVAPAENQSGVSHSLATYEPIYLKPYRIDGVDVGYSAKTTPAMCVILAVENLLPRRPDLVISGINRGANPGWITYLSGTVGAARQGAMCGIKSIATSMETSEESSYAAFARAIRPLVEKVLATPLPADVFLNVNGPAQAEFPKGVRLTRDSRVELAFSYKRETNIQGRELVWVTGKIDPKAYPEDTDWGAIQNGYIAVTVLSVYQEARVEIGAIGKTLGLAVMPAPAPAKEDADR
jgi:5'-nucleotidase